MRRWSTILVSAALVLLSVGLVVQRGRASREVEELAFALGDDLVAWRANPWPRPPLAGDPVDGHALDFYNQALDHVVLFDTNASRALAAWHDRGTPLPSGFEALAQEAEPGLELLSQGTRTFTTGIRPPPGAGGMDVLQMKHLAQAAEVDVILAIRDGDMDRAVRRSTELMRLGYDVARGGNGLDQHVGNRFTSRGLRLLEILVGRKDLPPIHRERILVFLRADLLRKETPPELLDGISIWWQTGIQKVLLGKDGEWHRDGSGWGSDLPALINPQYVTDGDFLEAWRRLRVAVSELKDNLERKQPPIHSIRSGFFPGTRSNNRIYAESCADLHRTLLALFDLRKDRRVRMRALIKSLEDS